MPIPNGALPSKNLSGHPGEQQRLSGCDMISLCHDLMCQAYRKAQDKMFAHFSTSHHPTAAGLEENICVIRVLEKKNASWSKDSDVLLLSISPCVT